MKATIKQLEKGFALMLGNHELGVSKTDVDARFHMYAINKALDAAFEAGQKTVDVSQIPGIETCRIMTKEEVDKIRSLWRMDESGLS